MDKIASFCVNHLTLTSGIYVSRKDTRSDTVVTTFDLRLTAPNIEPVLDTAAIHTMEHIGATFLRNSAQKNDVIYFGPMGCKTGFYLVMFGDLKPEDVVDLVKKTFEFIGNFKGEIPGATARDCGNYSLQNLDMANYYGKKYYETLKTKPCFTYPD
ncbi:MAG: S-ribosylhomocysteine lyase [Clostridia bacterium]